jgi:predicted RNase H-like nuclease (RuvC/YqgF family)
MTDFERILYLTRYVKILKEDIANRDFKIGELTSEIDELKYNFKRDKPENYRMQRYKIQIKQLRAKLRKYKVDNDRLVAKLCLIKIKDA